MKSKNLINFFLIILLFGFLTMPVGASDDVEFCSLNNYSLKIDEETIKAGYTIKAFGDSFTVGIFPDVLSGPTRINLKNITKLSKELKQELLELSQIPEGWKLNSDIYEYDLSQKQSYDQEQPLIVKIAFGQDTDNYKKIFYFDGTANEWRPLPSTTDWNIKKVQTKSHLPYIRLAIFDQIDIMGRGKASWYNQALFKYFKYRNGDYAASQQYPKGTKLRVKCLKDEARDVCNEEKTVIITVNDYGPEKWTGRIIDLDVSAFKKLGWKGLGWILVSVEPIE
jgi:rare lipoprotein A (peptidoglycan hydrolase)